MTDFLDWLFVRIEFSWHMTDAYLAECRGDLPFAADCACRAMDCQRRLDLMEINRAYR